MNTAKSRELKKIESFITWRCHHVAVASRSEQEYLTCSLLKWSAPAPTRIGAAHSVAAQGCCAPFSEYARSARDRQNGLRSDLRNVHAYESVRLQGKPQGVEFIATNSGYRGGLLGPRIGVEATQAFLLDLPANMTVVMVEDGTGQELGRTSGRTMSGNPINATMRLARALKESGIELKPDDRLSLGRFLPRHNRSLEPALG